MRMYGNPTLRNVTRKAENGAYTIESEPATYGGIALKSGIFAVVTLAAAILSAYYLQHIIQSQNVEGYVGLLVGVSVSAIPMIVISLIIAFKPRTASYLGMVYSVLQGMLLGVAVGFVDLFYPGVGIAALLATVVVFLVAIATHKLFGTRVSGKFVQFLMITLFSLLLVEMTLWIVSMFVPTFTTLMSLFWIQLLVSAVTVMWASFMLVMDVASIDALVRAGADKKYEWIAAFSLVTTLVWLYLEILELLVRLLALFGRSRN